ncbi:response regulator transcription factor [Vallitaleaceae bacterium 9-2]
MIKVMVVDDQILLKQTLLFMLKQDKEIIAIDGGEDGYMAIENCKIEQPNIILMDLRMPRMGGLEAMEVLKELYPSVKIMVLTTFEDDKSLFTSLKNGADGYIVKDIRPEELILAVKSVAHNLYVMHGNVLEVFKDELKKMRQKSENNNDMIDQYDLTRIEIRIIQELVNGKSNREIAQMLNFTEGTVKNKVSKLLTKLDLKDRTQMAVFAVKNNLI